MVGFGEPMNYEHWRPVAQAVDDMAEYLVGRDPLADRRPLAGDVPIQLQPEYAGAGWCVERDRDGNVGCVRQESVGLPVWKLLGGSVRRRVRVYTASGGSTPQECAENAKAAVARGFSAVKMGGSQGPVRFVDTPKAIDSMVARVAAVREAVGDEVDIAVDLHRRFSPTMAQIFVRELEPLRPLFAEEPCHPENNEPLLALSQSTTVPIATGERHLTRWSFREVIEREMCAILQPDIRHSGGIMELKKIANDGRDPQHGDCPAQRSRTHRRGSVGARHSDHTQPTHLRGWTQSWTGSV